MAVVIPLSKKPRHQAKRARHRRAKLNDSIVRAMAKGERVYDGGVPGLYAQRGKRRVTFRVIADLPTRVWKAKLDGPQTLERTIGHFPAMTAKRARIEGARVIAAIKSGTDPREPEQGPSGPTLKQAWHDYKTDFMVKRGRSEKTKRFYEFCFARLKHWHDKPLAVIASNPNALANEHARIARQHRRKDSDGSGAADSTLAFLGRVYNRVRAKGGYKLPPWPDKAVEMFGPRSRAHRGMGAKDLLGWWSEAKNLEPIKRQFVLFLLLSGLRANDAMTARWEHVNESEHTLLIPRPKGHRDDKPRSFKLPISEAMLECLRQVSEEWTKDGRQRSAWLFPSLRSGLGHIADARAQFTDNEGKEHYVKTGHDLRHSFANVAKEAHVPEEVVGRLLNHKPRTITGSYSDPNATPGFYLEMMERISRTVTKAIGLSAASHTS